jgi:hypothetical protein
LKIEKTEKEFTQHHLHLCISLHPPLKKKPTEFDYYKNVKKNEKYKNFFSPSCSLLASRTIIMNLFCPVLFSFASLVHTHKKLNIFFPFLSSNAKCSQSLPFLRAPCDAAFLLLLCMCERWRKSRWWKEKYRKKMRELGWGVGLNEMGVWGCGVNCECSGNALRNEEWWGRGDEWRWEVDELLTLVETKPNDNLW